jgi:hypothetical protein
VQGRWRLGGSQVGEQAHAILPDLASELLASFACLGQTILLDPPAVTLEPLGRRVGTEPVRCGARDGLQGCPHRLSDLFQAIEEAQRTEDVGRVRALPTPLAQQALRPAACQDSLKREVFQPPAQQACPELAEHGVMEA